MIPNSLKRFKVTLLCLVLNFNLPSSLAQTFETINYPFATDFYQYLENRVQQLQKKLLTKCRDSSITSYTNSDFLKTMSKKQVDMSGADFYLTVDSYDYTPIKYTNLKGFVFAHQFDTDLNSSSISGHIKGLALMTDDPFIRDIQYWHPVVWIKWEDLKKSISPTDFQFIEYMYHLNARIGQVNTYNLSGDIDYEDLLFKNTFYYGTDSIFLMNCSEILANGQYFINIIRYTDFEQSKDSTVKPAIIYSDATEDSVALYRVGLEQYKTPKTDSSIVLFNGCISETQQLRYDRNTHKLIAFIARTDADYNQTFDFIIPPGVYNRIRFGKDIIWFLEDYYSWQRPNYFNTPIRKK